MPTEAFTVKAESDLVHQLDDIAESLDESRNDLVNQAIKAYLENHAWQVDKIHQGIAATSRGELIEHDEVMQEIEALIDSKAQILAVFHGARKWPENIKNNFIGMCYRELKPRVGWASSIELAQQSKLIASAKPTSWVTLARSPTYAKPIPPCSTGQF